MPYFRSEDRWIAGALLAGIVVVELGLVAILVAVNEWNKRFFNALESRDWSAAQFELLVFCVIALAAVVAGTLQYFLGQRLIIRWRRWITERYVAMWMAHGRHYRVRLVEPDVDNIHLRIASDVLIFLTRTHELFTSLIGSIVTIVSFVAILWFLSATTPLPLFGGNFAFAGWLIVVAASYAAIGTLFTHLIGRPLIPLNFSQQRYEADFRFAIARATDQSEPVALMGGEAVERRELRQRFGHLVGNWTQTRQPPERPGWLYRRLRAHVDGISDAGGDAGLSLRRDFARRPGTDGAGVPECRGSAGLLYQRLQQDRRMEGGDGPSRASSRPQ